MKKQIFCIKKSIVFFALFFIINSINIVSAQTCEPYLSLTTPENIPIKFGTVEYQANDEWHWHGSPVFSPNGDEMYFTKYEKATAEHTVQIWFTKCINNEWSVPQRASFSNLFYQNYNPCFAGNDTLYFHSVQQNSGLLYRVVRNLNGEWEQPTAINLAVPSGYSFPFEFSRAKNGNVYIAMDAQNDNSELFMWQCLDNDTYASPVKLTTLCSPNTEATPFIDPNERYIIFSSSRSGGYSSSDLYISYHNIDGTWGTPMNMGHEINEAIAFYPNVSPDKKYLFFSTIRPSDPDWNAYWVKTDNYISVQDSLPYLGQTPPDTIPKRFGPSYLQSNGTWWWHGTPQFSPDGKEMFFVKYQSDLTAGNIKMYFMRDNNGEWSLPTPPSFACSNDDNAPVFSNDGNKLFFVSTRDGSNKVYFVTRTANGWSEPQMLDLPYQSLPGVFTWDISLTNDGTIYFTVWDNIGSDIYRSKPVNGVYSNYEKLPEEINTTSHDNSAYISPDEKYIIFASNRSGFGFHDLFISFKKSDGSWTPAQNLGNKINGSDEEGAPSVSADGKYLFFNSFKTGDYGYNAYWVDAAIINEFNPFVGIDDLIKNSTLDNKLLQNYPNPCNSKTIISFELEKSSDVSLVLYNQVGVQIAELIKNRTYQSGKHEIIFDVSKFPVGIYNYTLISDNAEIQSKKIVVIK